MSIEQGELTDKRLLGLFAHPDDESFICGGTLAHYAKQGVQVRIVSATKGEMGRRMGLPPAITRESMPQVREEELREACRSLGIEAPQFLGIRDKTVEYEDFGSLVRRLEQIITEFRPQIVLTFHPKWGGHPDHCAIGKAAVEAMNAFGPKAGAAGAASPQLWFITFGNPIKAGDRTGGLTPDDVFRVDISDSLREKLQSFRAHRSQTELDPWIWESEEKALSKFEKFEYFIAGRVVTGKNGKSGWF